MIDIGSANRDEDPTPALEKRVLRGGEGHFEMDEGHAYEKYTVVTSHHFDSAISKWNPDS